MIVSTNVTTAEFDDFKVHGATEAVTGKTIAGATVPKVIFRFAKSPLFGGVVGVGVGFGVIVGEGVGLGLGVGVGVGIGVEFAFTVSMACTVFDRE
jgi:hypothetical protein